MLTEPLPTILDVRKAAVRGVGISGVLRPLDLKRFRPLLGSNEGDISVEMAFSRDEENRYLVHVAIDAHIVVICQRCLEPMPAFLSCKNILAILWTEEEAAHLPRHLDPLMVGEPFCNLWELVEDELILAVRPYSYHDLEDCKTNIAAYSEPAPKQGKDEGRPNPFDVLRQLKPGNR
jgi:uncharacterized protein